MTRLLVTIILLLSACAKDASFKPGLAINQRTVTLNAVSDTAKMMIYANGSWTLENRDNASWITLLQGQGKGQDYAIVSAPDNSAGMARVTTLVVRSGSLTDTIRFGQRGVTTKIAITATAVSVPAAASVTKTFIDTNLPLSMMSLSYNAGTDWISGVQLTGQDMQFSSAANTTAATRRGVIYLRYLDVLGTTTQDSLVVNQAKP